MEKREVSIKLRLTESELAQIQCRMQEYGTSNMSAFIRKMAIDGYIVKLELPELKEMTRLLASYSNNLNQIAKRVNATSNLYSADIEEIHRQQDELWLAAEKDYPGVGKVKIVLYERRSCVDTDRGDKKEMFGVLLRTT